MEPFSSLHFSSYILATLVVGPLPTASLFLFLFLLLFLLFPIPLPLNFLVVLLHKTPHLQYTKMSGKVRGRPCIIVSYIHILSYHVAFAPRPQAIDEKETDRHSS